MAYYIISFEPEQMKLFQKKNDFLDDAIWINEKKDLAQLESSPLGDAYFFVHFAKSREAIDELVLNIRENSPTAKIIYVVEDPKTMDLKTHQMTPVGGDAYVSLQIESAQLYSMLEGLTPPEFNQRGNRLEVGSNNISAQQGLEELRNNPKNQEIEKIFAEVFTKKDKKPTWQKASDLISEPIPDELEAGDNMSDKDQDLSLDDLGELEISSEGLSEPEEQEEEGLDFDLDDDMDLELSDPDELSEDGPVKEPMMELDIGTDFSLDSGGDPVSLEAADDLGSFSLDDAPSDIPELSSDLSLDDEVPALDFDIGGDDAISLSDGGDDLSLSDDLSLDDEDSLDLGADIDLSDDAKEKLKEIDAIMDYDASQISIKVDLAESDQSDNKDDLGLSLDEDLGLSLEDDGGIELGEVSSDSDIDTSLVSDDLDLGSISFSNEEEEKTATPVQEEKNKKKPKENKEVKESSESYDGAMGRDFKEISGAYTGEMERMQATISNLRSDREELLARIQKLEEDKTLQNRQTLTMRAELDEKKIELSIIRKKLNDEVSELRDRLKLFEEKKIILEEKNRLMAVELDKTAHKNKIDVKKVQMRERELEQKLELLKADSESQIRHRDMKILELKRKLDAMEFDIESISVQEKRSVESRFELEDKLDKALKTLRNAITVLEDESENRGTLEALKKNIDM
jgi:hypothetical protein